MNETVTQQVARRWVGLADAMGLNPKTKAYKVAHQAFLAGVAHVLGEKTPTLIGICLASGRDITSILERIHFSE